MSYSKERVTFSLNKRTVGFLRRLAKTEKKSLSAQMEKIVAGVIRQEELSQLNARVSAYYDAFSDQERKDDAAWGEFGETELAHIGS